MSGLGKINIRFSADLKGFSTSLQNANRKISKMGKNMQRVGSQLTVGVTAPFVAFGALALKSWDQQEQSIAQVNAGLKSTGRFTESLSQKLQEQAAVLQNNSLFGDEDILANSTAQILSFTNIATDTIPRVNQVVADLSTRLKVDLKSSALQVSKALNSPLENLSALSRSGIQFSESQKKMIKSLVSTNQLAEAQNVILTELENQFGGSAKAASEAGLGGFKQLSNSLGDLAEDFGAIIAQAILPFVAKIKSLIASFKALSPETKKWIVILGGVAAAAGPILALAGTILPMLITGFTLLTGPVGLVIAGLTAIGVVIYKNWEPIKAQLSEIANYFIDLYNESTVFRIAVESVGNQFQVLWTIVKLVFKNIYTVISTVVQQLINQFKAMGAVLKGALTFDFSLIKQGVLDFGDATKKNISEAIDGFTLNFGDAITDVSQTMKESLDRVLKRPYKIVVEVETKEEEQPKKPAKTKSGSETRPVATALDTSGMSVGIQPLVDSVNAQAADLEDSLAGVEENFASFGENIAIAIEQTTQDALVGFGNLIGGLISGGANITDFADFLLSSFGNLLIQLGKIAIQAGVGIEAIKGAFASLSGFGAIAIGVALVAFGNIIKGKLSKVGQSGGKGGNYAGAFAKGGIVGGSSFSGDKLFARVNSGEMILNNRQQSNLSKLISPASQMVDIVLGGEITADAGKLRFVLDKYDKRQNRKT
tara:strand:+ start:7740 stop:9869 length:2130 start_codon:yes stop_codon:yes gene_type:complete